MKIQATPLFILTVLSCVATTVDASDNWQFNAGAARFSESNDGLSLALGAIYIGAGYRIDIGNEFFVIPEARFGAGFKDDNIFGQNIDLDSFIAGGVRGQWENSKNGLFLFGRVSYAEVKFDAGFVGSATGSDLGLGVGGGYNFTDKFAVEISWEDFDGTSVLSVGTTFRF